MYYPDLSHDCDFWYGDDVRAIGWLSAGEPYPRGAVPPAFLECLRTYVERFRTYVARRPRLICTMGYHTCEFCLEAGAKRPFSSQGSVLIPAERAVYVAPVMVVHYVRAHGYAPPEEFVAAVMECPEPGSPEYLRRLVSFPSFRGAASSSFPYEYRSEVESDALTMDVPRSMSPFAAHRARR